MKIVAIGDIHGHESWKAIVNTNKADLYVFVGDYPDSQTISVEKQLNNFLDILEFKRSFPDNTILLIGNHCYHYFRFNDNTYTGFNPVTAMSAEYIYRQAYKEGLLKVAHLEGNILFTHAGVTHRWCNEQGIDKTNIAESINELFHYRPLAFDFLSGGPFTDDYGNNTWQGPLWVRPGALLKNRFDKYIQVVGHTDYNYHKNSVYFIDKLKYGQYLVIENGKISWEKLET